MRQLIYNSFFVVILINFYLIAQTIQKPAIPSTPSRGVSGNKQGINQAITTNNDSTTNNSTQGVTPVIKETHLEKQSKVDITGFGSFQLLKKYDDVQSLFEKAPYSFLILNQGDIYENKRQELIAYKNDFFDHFRLQFNKEGDLYLIEIGIKKANQNYNELYAKLKEKYGMPQEVTYNQVKWKKNKKVLVFRRDGIIRYMALDAFEVARRESQNDGEKIKDKELSEKKDTDEKKDIDSQKTTSKKTPDEKSTTNKAQKTDKEIIENMEKEGTAKNITKYQEIIDLY